MIGILQVVYHFPHSQNLKEKRQILRSLKQILRKKFNISISEIDYKNLWQKSLIGISMISDNKKFVDKIFNKIIEEFNYSKKGYILDYNTEYIHTGKSY